MPLSILSSKNIVNSVLVTLMPTSHSDTTLREASSYIMSRPMERVMQQGTASKYLRPANRHFQVSPDVTTASADSLIAA